MALGITVLAIGQLAVRAVAGEFQAAIPGYVFKFPVDHAAHPSYRTEWWYYTGHLWIAGEGETQHGDPSAAPASESSDLGFQLTFFRSGVARPDPPRASAWAVRDLFFAHLAISDFTTRRFHYAERLARDALGLSGADSTAYHVWVDDWSAKLEAGGGHQLVAHEGDVGRDRPGGADRDRKDAGFGLELRLVPVKPPVLHGEAGLSRKGPEDGQASHYYSLTRLAAEGIVRLGDRELGVRGEAWMDHEFTTGNLAPGLAGWDWFSVQLDDRSEMMLYVLRRTDGTPAAESSGTLIDPAGLATHVSAGEFRVEVGRRWTSPRSGATYPAGWTIRVPKAELVLEIEPRLADQELVTSGSTGVTYWEGGVSARGTRRGEPIAGHGYVELTGYAESFRARM